MRGRFGSALALLVGLGCAPDASLVVDLKTDFVPTFEFGTVRTELLEEPTSEAPTGPPVEHPVEPGEDYLAGTRVAEIGGVDRGASVYLRVSLLDGGGRAFERRVVAVDLAEGPLAVTVLLTRDCRGVRCPGPDGPAEAIACLAGRCVEPRCLDEASSGCVPLECEGDADCVPDIECATGRCVAGVCLEGSAADACGGGDRWCDPDRGCAPTRDAYTFVDRDCPPAGTHRIHCVPDLSVSSCCDEAHPTVEDGTAAAQDDEILLIGSGTYVPPGTHRIQTAIRIVGIDTGGGRPIIDGSGGTTPLGVATSRITIDSLEVTNGTGAAGTIMNSGTVATVTDLTLRDLFVHDNDTNGIYYNGGGTQGILRLLIQRCRVERNLNVAGFAIYGASESGGIRVHDSCFSGNPRGVQLEVAADLRDNYWGDPSGPSGIGGGSGDELRGPVSYEPFRARCDLP